MWAASGEIRRSCEIIGLTVKPERTTRHRTAYESG